MKNRITTILIAALLSTIALAQATDFETLLSGVLASETDGVVITCPAGYPISELAACYRVWGTFDLTSADLNRVIRGFSDAAWTLPWAQSDSGDVMARWLQVDNQPVAVVVLTQSPTDDFETIVWVIENLRWP